MYYTFSTPTHAHIKSLTTSTGLRICVFTLNTLTQKYTKTLSHTRRDCFVVFRLASNTQPPAPVCIILSAHPLTHICTHIHTYTHIYVYMHLYVYAVPLDGAVFIFYKWLHTVNNFTLIMPIHFLFFSQMAAYAVVAWLPTVLCGHCIGPHRQQRR